MSRGFVIVMAGLELKKAMSEEIYCFMAEHPL